MSSIVNVYKSEPTLLPIEVYVNLLAGTTSCLNDGFKTVLPYQYSGVDVERWLPIQRSKYSCYQEFNQL